MRAVALAFLLFASIGYADDHDYAMGLPELPSSVPANSVKQLSWLLEVMGSDHPPHSSILAVLARVANDPDLSAKLQHQIDAIDQPEKLSAIRKTLSELIVSPPKLPSPLPIRVAQRTYQVVTGLAHAVMISSIAGLPEENRFFATIAYVGTLASAFSLNTGRTGRLDYGFKEWVKRIRRMQDQRQALDFAKKLDTRAERSQRHSLSAAEPEWLRLAIHSIPNELLNLDDATEVWKNFNQLNYTEAKTENPVRALLQIIDFAIKRKDFIQVYQLLKKFSLLATPSEIDEFRKAYGETPRLQTFRYHQGNELEAGMRRDISWWVKDNPNVSPLDLISDSYRLEREFDGTRQKWLNHGRTVERLQSWFLLVNAALLQYVVSAYQGVYHLPYAQELAQVAAEVISSPVYRTGAVATGLGLIIAGRMSRIKRDRLTDLNALAPPVSGRAWEKFRKLLVAAAYPADGSSSIGPSAMEREKFIRSFLFTRATDLERAEPPSLHPLRPERFRCVEWLKRLDPFFFPESSQNH